MEFGKAEDLLKAYESKGKIPPTLSPFDFNILKETIGNGADNWREFMDALEESEPSEVTLVKFHIRLFLLENALFKEHDDCLLTLEHEKDIYDYWLSIRGGDDVDIDDVSLPIGTKSNDKYRMKLAELRSLNGVSGSRKLNHLISSLDKYVSKTNNYRAIASVKTLLQDLKSKPPKVSDEVLSNQTLLYDACEKVLEELKAFKEHSFPFLAKVNRREAPDYYEIIKNPMDLGTMSRKLKSMQYRTKNEFVTDLKLIWDNCLYYNSDPVSIYRVHATEMMKKAEIALQNVPDIALGSKDGSKKDDDYMQTDHTLQASDYAEVDSDSSSDVENTEEVTEFQVILNQIDATEKEYPKRNFLPSSEDISESSDEFPFIPVNQSTLYRRDCDEFMRKYWESIAETAQRRSIIASGLFEKISSQDFVWDSIASESLCLHLPPIEVSGHSVAEKADRNVFTRNLSRNLISRNECHMICEKLLDINPSQFRGRFMEDEILIDSDVKGLDMNFPSDTGDQDSFQNIMEQFFGLFALNCGFDAVKKSSMACFTDVICEFLNSACVSAKLIYEQNHDSYNAQDFIYQLACCFGIFDLDNLTDTLNELDFQTRRYASVKKRLLQLYSRNEEQSNYIELVDEDARYITGNVFHDVCEDYLGFKSVGLGHLSVPNQVMEFIEHGEKRSSLDSSIIINTELLSDIVDTNDLIGLAVPFFKNYSALGRT